MATDEHGLPMPHNESPLPWSSSGNDEWAWVKTETGKGNYETGVCEPYFRSDADFIAHAANNIVECRDIVRRLAKWAKSDLMDDIDDIIDDAVRTLDRMKREANGDDVQV